MFLASGLEPLIKHPRESLSGAHHLNQSSIPDGLQVSV
jgi:hypothetical protein